MKTFRARSKILLSLLSILGPVGIARSQDSFPSIIHKAVSEADDGREQLQATIKSTDASTLSADEERAVFLFSRGLSVFEDHPKQAAADFEAAKKLLPEQSPLAGLAAIYHSRATLTPANAKVLLGKLKTMTKVKSYSGHWRPEQFVLMIEILMSLKQDALLAKTWAEMESRVRPAQRSDDLARKVVAYIDRRDLQAKTDLIPIVESMAAAYPHSETATWAFQKLQHLTCSKKNQYVFSLSLMTRLAANTNLDDGLKQYIIELMKGPVRVTSGQIKIFDEAERIDYLYQIRFWNEAKKLAEDQIDSLKFSQSSEGKLRLARAMNNLGQIQIKQGDYEAAARTWSEYIEVFGGQADPRAAMENLADSMSRLRMHGVAAKIYESLAQSPSSDPVIKWHHFWNTYLAADYKGALALLDRPGYVPQRDRGIDGGLDYWRARILERLGQSAEAEGLYKKILTSNGENFYAILVMARKPKLLESIKSFEASLRTVSFETNNDADGFQPAEEISSNEVTQAPGNEADFKMVVALNKWGQSQVARRIFRILPTVHQRNGHGTWVESFRLALDLRDYSYGLKVPSMTDSPLRFTPSSAIQLETHMSQHSADWKLLYPYAYRDIVESMSKAADIDPFLVLGVMRAESVYDVDARSIVGARGLMQIMPFTAVRIARMMDDYRFELADLHKPEVNIGYASYYLKKLVDYYRGNSVLAVAAYNGGPISVDRWVRHYGNLDVDEFVETMPFKETRRYVKSVFKNFNQYKNVWQQSKALASLPKVPDDVAGGEIF